MTVGICVMVFAGWKLLIGLIGSFEFGTSNYQDNDNSPLPVKFVKRSEESHQVENNDEGRQQVFIPVVSVY